MNKKFIVSISLLVLSPALIFPMAEAMMHQAVKTPKAPEADKRPDPMHKAMHKNVNHGLDHPGKSPSSPKNHTMPTVPKIDPIPPMHENKPHEPGILHMDSEKHEKPHLLGNSPDKQHPHMPSVPHSTDPMHHINKGHSKIQVAIDSMNKGIASMKEAVGNLSSVQDSIEKIKSAISELLNTHLSNIG